MKTRSKLDPPLDPRAGPPGWTPRLDPQAGPPGWAISLDLLNANCKKPFCLTEDILDDSTTLFMTYYLILERGLRLAGPRQKS